MTEQPVGPRCGNNPNVQLTDGDRKAVDDFKARLALRDRIAHALAEVTVGHKAFITVDVQAEYPRADAVLAVLPEPADRAAILREAAERVTGHAADHFPDEYDDYADQLADELRRMADEAQQPCPGYETAPNLCTCDCEGCKHHCAAHQAVEAQQPEICELPHLTIAEEDACEQHRLGDEAQQPDVEAHPARDRWYIEILDGDGWDLTSRFHTERAAAVRDMDRRNGAAPQWDDGKPVRRRLVRETTTHTVESAVSQPGKEEA